MLHERTVGTVPYPHSHGCEPYTHHFANSHAPTSSHLVPWPTLAPSPISLSSGGGVAIVPLALALTFPVRHRHDGHNCTHHAVVPLARALTRPSPHPGQVGTAQHAQLRRYAVAPLAHTHTHPRPHPHPPSPTLSPSLTLPHPHLCRVGMVERQHDEHNRVRHSSRLALAR
jgi:hypothetical protein